MVTRTTVLKKTAGNSWVRVYENGIAKIELKTSDVIKDFYDYDEIKITIEAGSKRKKSKEWQRIDQQMMLFPFMALFFYPIVSLVSKVEKLIKR